MVSVAEQRPEKLEIGRVFGATFGVIGRNLVLCLLLGALLQGLPTALQQYWLFSSLSPLLDGTQTLPPDQMPAIMHPAWIVAIIVTPLALMFILQAALVRAAIEDLGGKQPYFGDCLGTGLVVALPVMGMSILIALCVGLATLLLIVPGVMIYSRWFASVPDPVSIGVFLGTLLLIVPGVMLFLRWFVSVPVLVHEKTGPLASMSRSGFLTYGNRWRLFWALVILFMLFIAAIPLQLLLEVLGGPTTRWIASFSLAIIIPTMFSIVATVACAVSYVELRAIKEGTGVDELA